MTRVLHTARISNIESFKCAINNEDVKRVMDRWLNNNRERVFFCGYVSNRTMLEGLLVSP